MVSSANQSSRSISPSSSQAATTMALHLVGDGGGVAPHELVPQRLVVEHLPTALREGVEDHALAEDGGHERVGLGLVEHLLGGPEEELVGLGPAQQHHVPVGQAELPDVAALGPDPGHEADRVDPQLLEVAVLAASPRDPGRLAKSDIGRHGVPPGLVGVEWAARCAPVASWSRRFGRDRGLGLDFDHRQVGARRRRDHRHHGVGHGRGRGSGRGGPIPSGPTRPGSAW